MHVHYNRSFPIQSYTESFELNEVDPRPIDADLERIYVNFDPRSIHFLWRDMENAFQIQRPLSHITEFRYILQARISDRGIENIICSRADAVAALQMEESRWLSGFEEGGLYSRLGGHANPDTPESLAQAPVSTLGFWTVPAVALGELPEGKYEDQRWSVSRMVDLRQYRPQLGIFHLLD